jgi:hypothetical protein
MKGCSKRSDAFCDTKTHGAPCKQDGEKRQSVIKQTFERKRLVNWHTQGKTLIQQVSGVFIGLVTENVRFLSGLPARGHHYIYVYVSTDATDVRPESPMHNTRASHLRCALSSSQRVKVFSIVDMGRKKRFFLESGNGINPKST